MSSIESAPISIEAAQLEIQQLRQSSSRLNATKTQAEMLSVLATSLDNNVNWAALYYIFDLDANGAPVWGEVASTWSLVGSAPLPAGMRFYLPQFPFTALWVKQPHHPTFIADVATDPRLDQNSRTALVQNRSRAIAIIPLNQAGRWIGFVSLSWDRPHAFSALETAIYGAFTNLASAIVDNHRLLIQQKETPVNTLYHISGQLNKAEDEEALLKVLAQPGIEHGATLATLTYIDQTEDNQPTWAEIVGTWQKEGIPGTAMLVNAIWSQIVAASQKEGKAPVSTGAKYYFAELPFSSLWLTSPNEPQLIADIATDYRANPAVKNILAQVRVEAMAAIPLTQNGRWLGIVSLFWSKPHAFNETEMAIYRAFTNLASPVIAHRRQVQQLQQLVGNQTSQALHFKDLSENVTSAIALANMNGSYLYANRAHYQLLGYDFAKQTLNGASIAGLLPPPPSENDQPLTPEHLAVLQAEAVQQLLVGWHGEQKVTRLDGSTFTARLTSQPLPGQDGSPASVAIFIEDITPQKQLEVWPLIENDLTQALSRATLDDAYALSLDAATRASTLERGRLYLINPATQTLDLAVYQSLPANVLQEATQLPLDHPITATLPIYANQSQLEAQPNLTAADTQLQTVAIVPVYDQGRLAALLHLGSTTITEVPPIAPIAIATIAGHVANAITRNRTTTQLRQTESQLEQLQEQLLEVQTQADTQLHEAVTLSAATLAQTQSNTEAQLQVLQSQTSSQLDTMRSQSQSELEQALTTVTAQLQALQHQTQTELHQTQAQAESALATLQQNNSQLRAELEQTRTQAQADIAQSKASAKNDLLALQTQMEAATAKANTAAGAIQQHLKAERAQLLDTVADWVWEADTQGFITASNAAGERRFGYQLHHLLGTSLFAHIQSDEQPHIQELFQQAVNQQSGWANVTIPWLHRAGSLHVGQSTMRPVLDQAGQLLHFIGVDHDLTQPKHAEKWHHIQRNLILALASQPEFHDALHLCLEAALYASELERGRLYLAVPESGELRLAAHQDLPDTVLQQVTHFAPHDPIALVLSPDSAIYASQTELHSQPSLAAGDEQLQAATIVPVYHNGQRVAALHLGTTIFEQMPDFAPIPLETIAAIVAHLIAQHQAQTELETVRRHSQTQLEAVQAAARTQLEAAHEQTQTTLVGTTTQFQAELQSLKGQAEKQLQETRHLAEAALQTALTQAENDREAAQAKLDAVRAEAQIQLDAAQLELDATRTQAQAQLETTQAQLETVRSQTQIDLKNAEAAAVANLQAANTQAAVQLQAAQSTAAEQLQAVRAQAQSSLRHSEHKLTGLLAALAEWVWTVDLTGLITGSNQAGRTLLGYEPVQLTGTSLFSLVEPGQQAHMQALFEQAVSQQAGWSDVTISWLHRDGSVRVCQNTLHPLLDEAGLLQGFRGINLDLTPRQQAQSERAAFLNQLRTAADISEQINATHNPTTLMTEVVTLLQTRFNLYHVQIYTLDNASRELVMQVCAGPEASHVQAQGHTIPLDYKRSLVTRAARGWEIVLVNNTSIEPNFTANSLLPNAQSQLIVPLTAGEKLLGVLDFQQDQLQYFSQADVDLFNALAGYLAAALFNLQLGQQQSESTQKQAVYERQLIEVKEQAIHSLPTPIIPMMPGMIAIPLIGEIDATRAKTITQAVLKGISQYQAKIVVLDVSGVPAVTSQITGYINETVQAAQLQGAQTLVTGLPDNTAKEK